MIRCFPHKPHLIRASSFSFSPLNFTLSRCFWNPSAGARSFLFKCVLSPNIWALGIFFSIYGHTISFMKFPLSCNSFSEVWPLEVFLLIKIKGFRWVLKCNLIKSIVRCVFLGISKLWKIKKFRWVLFGRQVFFSN